MTQIIKGNITNDIKWDVTNCIILLFDKNRVVILTILDNHLEKSSNSNNISYKFLRVEKYRVKTTLKLE